MRALSALTLCTPLAASLLLSLPAAAQSAPPADADKKAVIQQQKENEDAETLCRVIKDKADYDKCLELYFLDQDQFRAFLDAHKPKPAPKA
ncbi:hypothetical protein [Nitrospirillum amazonense]|uniref:Conjugative transfer region protein TrbK n=1 Tax=Nitrospirillum amazonense TaxID=28077 RepID=A0A560F048_9PROT|nr:hypothetical protein [Nitrospirillum amazonense]MDG3439985.1 hypothetical protein [Nitrospirillum amazonense]MEC4594052.1 hypothetical protein [Nitrospirillum amazonense]TWB15001.1 hypothetical protein FBZ88_13235 [Nitrospirillum amazonense]